MKTVNCNNRTCNKEYSVAFEKCPFCGTPNQNYDPNAPTENSYQQNSMGGSFHWLVYAVIFYNIVRGVILAIGSIINMAVSPSIGIVTFIISATGLASLAYILKGKSWALLLWMAYRIVAGIFSMDGDVATSMLIAFLNIGLMVLLLQVKRDGVSAWSLIFRKEHNS